MTYKENTDKLFDIDTNNGFSIVIKYTHHYRVFSRDYDECEPSWKNDYNHIEESFTDCCDASDYLEKIYEDWTNQDIKVLSSKPVEIIEQSVNKYGGVTTMYIGNGADIATISMPEIDYDMRKIRKLI